MPQLFERVRAALRELFAKERLRRERDEEFRFHLESEIDHNLVKGMSPADARRAALIAFGGVTRFREETDGPRSFASIETVAREVRLAARRLRRAPAYTVGVIGTVAIALAAAAGIGALVTGVLVRPLPYPDPDRLVRIAAHTPGLGLVTDEHSAGTFRFVEDEARALGSVGAYTLNEGVTITDGNAPERIVGAPVTTNLLSILGVTPIAGRLFVPEDAIADTSGVILAEPLWRRRFGADPAIVGATIELNRRRRVILGVVPASNEPPWDRVSLYYPTRAETGSAGLSARYLTVIGRLSAGATLADLERELVALSSRLHERYPELSAAQVREAGFRLTATSLHDAVVAPVRAELRLLALMVGVLGLIAVANVTALALLRAERLRGEVAVSRALGASRAAIGGRFLAEGALLALVSALVALPIAAAALEGRFGFTAGEIPRLEGIRLGWELVAAVIIVAITIGLLVGIIAAARVAGAASAPALRTEGRVTSGQGWARMRTALVAVQVAFALSLLVAAGLLAESFLRLQRVDLGFRTAGRATFALFVPGAAYRTWDEVTGFHARVEAALRATPGVDRAAAAMELPSTPRLLYVRPRLDATRRDGRATQALVTMNVVSPTFFGLMGIPIEAGRDFESRDLASSNPSVILSASLARDLFGAEDPVGREVNLAAGGRRRFPTYRVVGVSGDVYGDRVADGVLRALYFPLVTGILPGHESPIVPAGVQFVIQSRLPLPELGTLFRAAVASVDAKVPLWGIRTLDTLVADTVARTRLTLLLLATAAVATLLLAGLGLYSSIAYGVAGRTREFAIRLALGTTPAALARLVLGEGSVVVGLGVVTGVALAIAGARLLGGMLTELRPGEPLLYVAAAAVVLATTGIAMLVPARRAARADPAEVLRSE